MECEVAVFNGFCEDANLILNSVKATYLYADKIRVYDAAINIGETDIKEQVKERLKDSQERYVSYIQYIKEHTFLMDPEVSGDDFLACIDSIPDEEAEWMLEAQKGFSDYLDLMLTAMYAESVKATQRFRKMSNKQYNRDTYLSNLKRLGIELIEPRIDNIGDLPRIAEPIIEFHNNFVDDSGFKLVNSVHSLSSETESFKIWTPAYLSEYAISNLPGFEEATVDEIVDIRRELDKYIVPYRSAIIALSQKIREMPDIESLKRECAELYLREIEPKVAAINAAAHDNNVFKNIAKNVITNKETWVSFGALAAAFATKGDIANAVSIGTATALGGLSIMQGIMSTIEEKKKIKENEMFFLYEAGQRLKK